MTNGRLFGKPGLLALLLIVPAGGYIHIPLIGSRCTSAPCVCSLSSLGAISRAQGRLRASCVPFTKMASSPAGGDPESRSPAGSDDLERPDVEYAGGNATPVVQDLGGGEEEKEIAESLGLNKGAFIEGYNAAQAVDTAMSTAARYLPLVVRSCDPYVCPYLHSGLPAEPFDVIGACSTVRASERRYWWR